MSIANEITRLQQSKADIKSAIETKGVTVGDITLDNYAAKVLQIPTGITPTGTININTNGIQDVTNYANANVQVPVPVNNHNAYKVASTAAMNQLTGMSQDDVCVVHENTVGPMTQTTNTNIGYLTFPANVTLPSAVTDEWFAEFRSTNYRVRLSLMIDATSVNIFYQNMVMGDSLSITYTSNDGINYTMQDPEYYQIRLTGQDMLNYEAYAPWQDLFGYFLYIGAVNFEGVYQYKGQTWGYLDIALNANADEMFEGNGGYTNTGVVKGELIKNKWAEKRCFVSSDIPAVVPETEEILIKATLYGEKYPDLYITEKDFGNSVNIEELQSNIADEITKINDAKYIGYSSSNKHYWIAWAYNSSPHVEALCLIELDTLNETISVKKTFSTSASTYGTATNQSLGFVKDDYLYLFRLCTTNYSKKISLSTLSETTIAACPHYNSYQSYNIPTSPAVFDTEAICIWRTRVYTYNINSNSWTTNSLNASSASNYVEDEDFFYLEDSTNCRLGGGNVVYNYNKTTRLLTKVCALPNETTGHKEFLGIMQDKTIIQRTGKNLTCIYTSASVPYAEIVSLYSGTIDSYIKARNNNILYFLGSSKKLYKMTLQDNLHLEETTNLDGVYLDFPYELVAQVGEGGTPVKLSDDLGVFPVKNIYYYTDYSTNSPINNFANDYVYIARNNQWETLFDYS